MWQVRQVGDIGFDIDGVWRIEGDRFIFTNDAFLGGLLSSSNEVTSDVQFELTIVGITDSMMTFEIGTAIDFTALAGYPSSLRRIGTVGFDRI